MADVLEIVELTALVGAIWWFARWTQRIEERQKVHRARLEALEAVEQERTEHES